MSKPLPQPTERRNPSMIVGQSPTTVIVVTAHWDDPPTGYNQVVLTMRDGTEYRMTPQDAQVLGARLNRAGGGSA